MDFERLYPQGLLCGLDSIPEGVGAVYLITNLINDKVYVGQTWVGVEARWKVHQGEARTRGSGHFHKAIRKHGMENFAVGLLGVAQTQEELDRLEDLWITCLNALDPSVGYNLQRGGGAGRLTGERLRLRGEAISKAFDDPERRKRRSNLAVKMWQSPAHRKKMAKIYDLPEIKQKMRQGAINGNKTRKAQREKAVNI